MIAVLDTSAALRIALNPGQSELLSRLASAAEATLAPQLMVAEATNALWKYVRAGVLVPAEAHRGLEACLELVDQLSELEPLAAEALDLALLAQRPVYDMYFVVLARRHSATLLTADESLQALARSMGIRTAS